MELSSPKMKKNLIFCQKKAFLIFREIELFKKTSYISGGNFRRSEKISYISGNGISSPNLKEGTFRDLKKFIIFREMEFLVPILKSSYIFSKKKFFLYFRRELAKP